MLKERPIFGAFPTFFLIFFDMKVFELHRTIALFEQNVQTAFVKKPNKFQVQVENFHTFPNRKKKFSLAVWKSVKLCQFFEQEA